MAWRGRHWPRALHTVSFNPHQGSATVITGTLSVCSTVNWQKPFERGRVVVRRVHRTLTPQKISMVFSTEIIVPLFKNAYTVTAALSK